MEVFICPSADGIHTLHAIRVEPTGAPRGMVQLVHGMSEYIERYLPLMEYLAAKGFLCFGHDHIGHGHTETDTHLYGHMPYDGGGRIMIRDVAAVGRYMREQYPSLPLVLFGHSMGSFVVRCTVTWVPQQYAALVICGTGGPQAALGAGKALTAVLRGFKGERSTSPLLYRLMFGGFNRRFAGEEGTAWLSRSTENVRAFDGDTACGVPFTIGGIRSLLYVNGYANSSACFAKTPQLPILLIAGEQDPVGDYGSGVQRVYERYRAAGQQDVTLRLFPEDRHEILNEIDREAVFAVVGDWLESHIGSEKGGSV